MRSRTRLSRRALAFRKLFVQGRATTASTGPTRPLATVARPLCGPAGSGSLGSGPEGEAVSNVELGAPRGVPMPEKDVMAKAKRDLKEGKSPSTAAGEFVTRDRARAEGKHGARSPQQAIAIGLSEARRASIPLRPPSASRASPKTRRPRPERLRAGRGAHSRPPSRKRSEAMEGALRRERRSSVYDPSFRRPRRAGGPSDGNRTRGWPRHGPRLRGRRSKSRRRRPAVGANRTSRRPRSR